MKKEKKSRRKRRLRTLANRLGWLAALVLIAILRRCAFGAALSLGAAAGRLAFMLSGSERRHALSNLAAAFPGMPEAERREIAARSFSNMGASAAAAVSFSFMSDEEAGRRVANLGEIVAQLNGVLSRGKGLIALTGHLGCWEALAGLPTRRLECGVNVVANRLNYGPFNDLLEKFRASWGLKTIYLSESPREIARALRRNEIVGLLPDQDISFLPGVFVDFFGRPAWTPVGPVLTAKLSGSPVYPYFLVREGRGFRFVWGEEIPMVFAGRRKEDLLENTKRWSAVFESFIRRYPDQWAWNHRRWKTRP